MLSFALQMLKIIRIALFPFSILYGLIILIRNIFYDFNVIKSHKFKVPIISVGNLVAGGTGKTPMTEYLIELLKNDHKIATLSRGYGRKTKGFIVAGHHVKSILIGDEPKQSKTKYPDIIVAVGEKRVDAINAILKNYHPEIILLDDAYQHRAVVPGISILLFDYSTIFKPDFILPTGNLREWKRGKNRADIIVITKCPIDLSPQERINITSNIKPKSTQKLFFSNVNYSDLMLYNANGIAKSSLSINDLKNYTVLLLTGIANPKPLKVHITNLSKEVITLSFNDHHVYAHEDVININQRYKSITNPNKIIITTEKDLMRLSDLSNDILGNIMPIYYIPISSKFFMEDENEFNKYIINYVRNNK